MRRSGCGRRGPQGAGCAEYGHRNRQPSRAKFDAQAHQKNGPAGTGGTQSPMQSSTGPRHRAASERRAAPRDPFCFVSVSCGNSGSKSGSNGAQKRAARRPPRVVVLVRTDSKPDQFARRSKQRSLTQSRRDSKAETDPAQHRSPVFYCEPQETVCVGTAPSLVGGLNTHETVSWVAGGAPC